MGFFFSSAQAQLLITSEGATAQPSALRINGTDISTLLSAGLTSFSLNTIPTAGTFNEIVPFADEFRVGFNGTFDVKLEVAFLTRDAVDNDILGAGYGFADGNYAAGDPGNVTLFSNYGSLSTNTFLITGTSALTDIVNFWHVDSSVGMTGDQTNPNIFQWFQATDDPTYNYYVVRVDDRGSDPSTKDFNDGVFLVRINTAPVGFEPVPEPSTYGMAGVVLIGVVAAVRRRSKANANVVA